VPLDQTALGQAIATQLKAMLVAPQNLPNPAPINAAMDKLGAAIAAGIVPHLTANATVTVDPNTHVGRLT
jgi:hypothetical protein